MSINSLITASKYTGELDKLFEQKAVTGFFADNNMRAKFVGAKTVLIPDVDFVGLADYDRDTGFSRGAITVANTSFTMQKDRARSLQIDREDMDETGIANLAGQILGEYVRTKVVPECDAYVLSKMAGIAKNYGQYIQGNLETPYQDFKTLVTAVRDRVGYDEELVCFIDTNAYEAFTRSAEISRMITVSDFKQGEVNLQVQSIDGVALLPVVTSRMKSAYDFLPGENSQSGGFKAAENAVGVYMIVCPKSAGHLVKKTETMRIFTPEQNLDADAYKFDYRVYYDVFVKKNEIENIRAAFAPSVSIATDVTAAVSKTAGSISGNLSVKATASDGSEVEYQWYRCNDAEGNGATLIPGANESSWTIDPTLEAGTYYVFAKITAGKSTVKNSGICTLTVS